MIIHVILFFVSIEYKRNLKFISLQIFFYILGVVEFDNEETSLSIFQELTNYQIDEKKSDLENFDWKPAKTFKINEKDLELLLRISDEEVK